LSGIQEGAVRVLSVVRNMVHDTFRRTENKKTKQSFGFGLKSESDDGSREEGDEGGVGSKKSREGEVEGE